MRSRPCLHALSGRSIPHARGPAVGLTFAAKDLFDVAGYPTSADRPTCSPCRASRPGRRRPFRSSSMRARAVGKTITDELAFSMSGKNAHFGTPVNGGAPTASRAARPRAPRRPCRTGCATLRSAPIRAARCGRRPAIAGSSASVRPMAGQPGGLLPTLRPPSTHAATSPATAPPSRVGEVLLGEDSATSQSPRVLLARGRLLLHRTVLDASPGPAPVGGCWARLRRSRWRRKASRRCTGRCAISSRGGLDGRWADDRALPSASGPGVADRFEFSKAVTDHRWRRPR